MKKEVQKARAAFRFLKPNEFAALNQEEKARYLQRAIKAVKSGHPLDDLPIDDEKPH